MKQLSNYLQIGFWILAVTCWALWLNERLEIFSFFVDGYKNVGYIVTTNTYQLTWYLVITLAKVLLVVLVMYKIIPNRGFSQIAVLQSLILMLILQGLEWLYCRALFGYLEAYIGASSRMTWEYDWLINLQIYLLFTLTAWILSAAYHWLIEYQNLRTLRQDQKAYMQLKEQLNPHFIFNSLNNLFELALRENNAVLQEGILDFTDTLRYTIDYANQPKVVLSRELEAIESFISLQQHRMNPGELELQCNFKLSDTAAHITPLLLLNYVENAFKHGYSYGKPSVISINVEENHGQLQARIKNTNHALSANSDGGNQKNLELLKLNYPNKYKLDITNTKEFYRLDLWIDLN